MHYKSSINKSVFSAVPVSPVSFLYMRVRAAVMAGTERLSKPAIRDTGMPILSLSGNRYGFLRGITGDKVPITGG